MTKVFLDGKETDINTSNKSWEELLKNIYELLKGKDRGVTSVKGDEEDLSGVISGVFPAKLPSEYREISFISEDVDTISSKGIENAIKFIPSLKKLIQGAAEFARVGKEKEMNEAIQASMEGIKLLITFLINVQTYYKFSSADITLHDGKSIDTVMTELNSVFQNFTEAQKSQELTDIADILEYELIEYIDRFNEIFTVIRDRVIGKKSIN